jgi:hypothetical protein
MEFKVDSVLEIYDALHLSETPNIILNHNFSIEREVYINGVFEGSAENI